MEEGSLGDERHLFTPSSFTVILRLRAARCDDFMVARICQRLDGSCSQPILICPDSDHRRAVQLLLLKTKHFSDTSTLLIVI